MSVQLRSMIPIAAIIAGVVLAFSLAGSPSISTVAGATEEVPAVAQVGVENLSEQPQRDAAHPQPSHPQMMNNDGDFWNGWWVIMPITMVLFWGGVIALVVWVVRQFRGDRPSDRSPLDIAGERLAKGEINKDEFEGIKGNLA